MIASNTGFIEYELGKAARGCHRIESVDYGCDFLDYREGSGQTVEIYDIQVGSDRRKGRGKALLDALFKSLPADTRVWAITRAENEVAQEFYEACGFRVCGVLRRFYSGYTGVDAIMFIRKAGGPL